MFHLLSSIDREDISSWNGASIFLGGTSIERRCLLRSRSVLSIKYRTRMLISCFLTRAATVLRHSTVRAKQFLNVFLVKYLDNEIANLIIARKRGAFGIKWTTSFCCAVLAPGGGGGRFARACKLFSFLIARNLKVIRVSGIEINYIPLDFWHSWARENARCLIHWFARTALYTETKWERTDVRSSLFLIVWFHSFSSFRSHSLPLVSPPALLLAFHPPPPSCPPPTTTGDVWIDSMKQHVRTSRDR